MKDYLCEAEDFHYFFEKNSEEVCRKYEITVIGLRILTFLWENPDSNTAKDICNSRLIKNSIASMTIDKLVTKGYIVRECDPKDRRKQRLKLTQEAVPIVMDGKKMRRRFEELIFEDFSREEIDIFLGMLDRICDSVRRRVNSEKSKKEGKGE